ncbi:hypothetical protein J3R83DRAFT_8853 [Lanmaoa asiatica]|nr:hypothetical protein J3R83DRAFT_8853 [Lanmaoa asiatica]
MSTSVPSAIGPPPLPVKVDNTLGALLIGGLFASAFWGITSVQTYIYYQRCPNDGLVLKLIVAILWFLDTFDACLTSHILYHYLVINYTNPSSIATPLWSLIVHTAVTSVTDVLIRCDGNIVLTSIVWIISPCDLIVGLSKHPFENNIDELKALQQLRRKRRFQLVSLTQLDVLAPLLYVSFVTSFAGDLYVFVVPCYYLFKSRTGFKSTDTLLNTLIGYTITTGEIHPHPFLAILMNVLKGALTSIDAILGTTLYAVMPTNYIFMAFYFNLAKLYINSYLVLPSSICSLVHVPRSNSMLKISNFVPNGNLTHDEHLSLVPRLNARQRFRRGGGPVSIELSALTSNPHFASGFTESTTEHSTPGVQYKASLFPSHDTLSFFASRSC